MKYLLLTSLLGASVATHAFPGDPGTGNTKMCIHHETGKSPKSYAMVVHPQACPPYVGTTTSDSGVVLQETHAIDAGPIFVPTNVSTSQHCWTEEKDMGN